MAKTYKEYSGHTPKQCESQCFLTPSLIRLNIDPRYFIDAEFQKLFLNLKKISIYSNFFPDLWLKVTLVYARLQLFF